MSFESIGISSCGSFNQSWRDRVNCVHIVLFCFARGDGFKLHCCLINEKRSVLAVIIVCTLYDLPIILH